MKEARRRLEKGQNVVTGGYGRHVFTSCRKTKPWYLQVDGALQDPQWQIGFFGADQEVYFDKISVGYDAQFASLVRNYWCNGKKDNGRKDGYYSLISQVGKLEVDNAGSKHSKFLNDLIDYMERRYDVGEHWSHCQLDPSMRIQFYSIKYAQLQKLCKYFNNISRQVAKAELGVENYIEFECCEYTFTNCKSVVPERLVLDSKKLYQLYFDDANNEVYFPDIEIKERGTFQSVTNNSWWNGSWESYSLLSHVTKLTIINNLTVVQELADFVSTESMHRRTWQNRIPAVQLTIFNTNHQIALIDTLRQLFSYAKVNSRKILGNERQQTLTKINANWKNIQSQLVSNIMKQETIMQVDTGIMEIKQRIEKARKRLQRRYVRFIEYIALTE